MDGYLFAGELVTADQFNFDQFLGYRLTKPTISKHKAPPGATDCPIVLDVLFGAF